MDACWKLSVVAVVLLLVCCCTTSDGSAQVLQKSQPQSESQLQSHTQSLPVQQTPLVRLPSNTLLKYTAYKDVSILHFRIPMDTRTALFSFKAYEETKSAFQRVCQPRDVTLHLKAGSYPVISPENITFPRHFLSAVQRFEIHNLQFKSDGSTRRLSVDGPNPGNWFAVAFISWTDPNNERIEQQGLAASCETLLLSEMSVVSATPVPIGPGTSVTSTLSTNATEPVTFKFYVPADVASVTWRLTLLSACTDCPDISFYVQAKSLPSIAHHLASAVLFPNQTGDIPIDFRPLEDAWHYVDLDFFVDEEQRKNGTRDNDTAVHQLAVNVSLLFNFYTVAMSETGDEDGGGVGGGNEQRQFHSYALLRQTYREFFMFDYDLLPDTNGTAPTSLNLTAAMPALFRFDVGDVYDIGGTLSFAIAIRQDIRGNAIDNPVGSQAAAVAEKLVDSSVEDEQRTGARAVTTSTSTTTTTTTTTVVRSNQTIIVCMRLGEPGIPTWPDKCVYGRHIEAAASVINNTDADTSTGLVHVPFPESGVWSVSLGLFCHGAETAARITIIDSVKEFIRQNYGTLPAVTPLQSTCPCSKHARLYADCVRKPKCLATLNETETLKIKECIMDAKCTGKHANLAAHFEVHHKLSTEQSVAVDGVCNASVMFTISSSPCVAGRCGKYGRCYHYMSGGFVFSTCLCMKGYRGWDCTEDSQVPSSISILMASLLLTLSNLLFIPSIYFAIHRKYLTEAIIYFFAMFFSIFYHACDSGEDEYSFCLVKIGVLQFCDFYCGLLAIWVTLIAMSHIRQTFVSLLHMFGAILLAFGTELNKQSLWVFLAPALTGICIISVSWGFRCRHTKKWFPARKYLAIYLPVGMVLVMVGLVCYAFLQTKQNYHIVHSIWHMVMALSILCLLPNRNTFLPKC